MHNHIVEKLIKRLLPISVLSSPVNLYKNISRKVSMSLAPSLNYCVDCVNYKVRRLRYGFKPNESCVPFHGN